MKRPICIYPPRNAPSIAEIVRLTAALTNVSETDILSRRRDWRFTLARWTAFALAREAGHSTPAIQRAMKFDHSTVVCGSRRVAEEAQTDIVVASWLAKGKAQLKDLAPPPLPPEPKRVMAGPPPVGSRRFVITRKEPPPSQDSGDYGMLMRAMDERARHAMRAAYPTEAFR